MSKCTASTRKQSAGATRLRSTRKARKHPLAPLQQRMPELFELPFVKIIDDNKEAPRWPEGFDYWAPDAVPSSLDGEFRGHVYALMTAEHLARHCNRGTSVLLRIMDAISAKGGVWPGRRHPNAARVPVDGVARGFIAGIANLMVSAALSGSARSDAWAQAKHLDAHRSKFPPRLKAERATLETAIKGFREFASQAEVANV